MFGLPPDRYLRFERPADALRDHLLSYAVVGAKVGVATVDWALPGWARMWFFLPERPFTISIGNRSYETLPPAVLVGVTSQVVRISGEGGMAICVDLSPRGMARLTSVSAETLRDRVTPLDEVVHPALITKLTRALQESDRSLEVKAVLDDFFLRNFGPEHPDEPIIAKIMALIADANGGDLGAAAAALEVERRVLRRLSKRYFGFAPKILMMRSRFLSALIGLVGEGNRADYGATPPGYHDVPHFIRDAQRFLGMTPRQFMALQTPFFQASLRARTLVLGASTPTLQLSRLAA